MTTDKSHAVQSPWPLLLFTDALRNSYHNFRFITPKNAVTDSGDRPLLLDHVENGRCFLQTVAHIVANRYRLQHTLLCHAFNLVFGRHAWLNSCRFNRNEWKKSVDYARPYKGYLSTQLLSCQRSMGQKWSLCTGSIWSWVCCCMRTSRCVYNIYSGRNIVQFKCVMRTKLGAITLWKSWIGRISKTPGNDSLQTPCRRFSNPGCWGTIRLKRLK